MQSREATGNTPPIWGGPIIAAMPVFNEEETIGSVVLSCKPHVDTVLCVDDGSSDSSSRIARKLGAEVHHHRANRGYGGALKTIFGTAQERRSRALVILDSDGQHEPSDIPHLLAPILTGEADVVIGSRFVDGGGAENMPAYRALGIKVITAASNLSSDLNIKDTQSGFRAFGPKALERLNFDHDGMESCLEILNACDDMQLKVKEVPTRIRYDVPKGSRYTALSHGFTVFSFALISLSQKKPLLFFGVPGISLLATGAAIGMRVLNELETITDGSVSLSVGPGLTAAWLGMLGMSLCFASLVLHGARRLMRRLLIEEFGMD
ncbi:MAG TPA: glycosyltransferase family 2 protein [Candidatus Poseidoniales archaeon]|nr:MAG TPA: glycosyltransferase family 2 protein [Candidatus Poseidoniales archaeon]HIH81693.1 glycosyltransferase family 2 protein [Candidatus Thalassarchaeaceae archaeon]|tara:strand:+ start:1128 stop:2093 length:966 start_codon:yes stop_codon:yes gene_type:complete